MASKAEQIRVFANGVSQIPVNELPSRPPKHEQGCFCETCRKYDAHVTITQMIWAWEKFRGVDIDLVNGPEKDLSS